MALIYLLSLQEFNLSKSVVDVIKLHDQLTPTLLL